MPGDFPPGICYDPVTFGPFRVTILAMKIYAHRGATGRSADENSLEAIRRAVHIGVDGIEVDIRRTRDDEAVLVHDPDLRRIAGDTRQISELSLNELQQVELRRGTRVVTLDEMTANVPPPIELDLEVKDQEALDLMIRKLRTSAGLRERAIITSFAQDVIERMARELPEVRSAWLMRRWPTRWASFSAWAREHQLTGIGLASRQWTARRVQRAHEKGLQAFAWEIFGARSNRRTAERMRHIGVDVAIVNQPKAYLQKGEDGVGRGSSE